ncbi:hypothetical protein F5B17DRAFT_274655 [Nemania serpens]|nr:hypothetical protein F5B17DRAFT_274655 [Nemania serpens]
MQQTFSKPMNRGTITAIPGYTRAQSRVDDACVHSTRLRCRTDHPSGKWECVRKTRTPAFGKRHRHVMAGRLLIRRLPILCAVWITDSSKSHPTSRANILGYSTYEVYIRTDRPLTSTLDAVYRTCIRITTARCRLSVPSKTKCSQTPAVTKSLLLCWSYIQTTTYIPTAHMDREILKTELRLLRGHSTNFLAVCRTPLW